VLVALYRIHRRPALHVANKKLLTHAWLPRDQFDEIREYGGWHFARRGDGYLALCSGQAALWNDAADAGEDRSRELVARGREHVWICELGRRARDGPFELFVERIAAAPLEIRGLSVRWESPSQGTIDFDWTGPLRCNGREIPLSGFARYDAPWVHAEYPSDRVRIEAGGHVHELVWDA
jgi:hypothetical protein